MGHFLFLCTDYYIPSRRSTVAKSHFVRVARYYFGNVSFLHDPLVLACIEFKEDIYLAFRRTQGSPCGIVPHSIVLSVQEGFHFRV
jgi:hypothetical protein